MQHSGQRYNHRIFRGNRLEAEAALSCCSTKHGRAHDITDTTSVMHFTQPLGMSAHLTIPDPDDDVAFRTLVCIDPAMDSAAEKSIAITAETE